MSGTPGRATAPTNQRYSALDAAAGSLAAVLEQLMLHAEVVVSRSHLLRNVWGMEQAPRRSNPDDGQRILVVGDLEDARDQAVRIASLIAAAGRVCLITGLSANITLISPPSLEVDIDGERVAQALLNVVSNSIRHNSDELNVRVDWLVDGRLLAIQVDDDGRGFPDRPDSDLLAPFVSGEAGGSGLGLSVAQTIAAAHGGRVILGSSPTGGARVVIEIPAVRP